MYITSIYNSPADMHDTVVLVVHWLTCVFHLSHSLPQVHCLYRLPKEGDKVLHLHEKEEKER